MLTLHFAPNSRASRIYWLLKELDLPLTDPSPLSRTLVSLFNLSRTWPRV